MNSSANTAANQATPDSRGIKIRSGAKVRIIATGGTIAGVAESPDSATYDPGQVTVDAILQAVPDVAAKVTLDGSQLIDPGLISASNPQGYVNVSSDFILEREWLELAQAVNQALNVDGYDAVVIPHGTDSMEETAYFLQMTVNSPKPVVLVGAMRPAVGSTPTQTVPTTCAPRCAWRSTRRLKARASWSCRTSGSCRRTTW